MRENDKLNVTLYVETLRLDEIENLAEMWIDEPIPKKLLFENCSWCETPEEFLKRKQFILPLLISKKLDIYETEYLLSDI
jgi:hypothetical protein